MSHPLEAGHWRYNPYEIAIFGPAGEQRRALASAIFARLSETREIAQLIEGGQRARGSHPAMLNGGWSGPVDSVYVRNQLLDAEMVIYEAAEWPNAPVVVVDSGRDDLSPDDWIPIILEDLAGKTAQVPVYGLVLAGGRSRRMKQDKAALVIHAEPQLRHTYHLLEDACDRAFVSTRPGQANDSLFGSLPRIEDRIAEIGPLGGILSAQMEHPGVAWLILACDLPFVTRELLGHIRALRNPTRLATAFCSSRDALPEPLCAVYEPKSHVRLLNFLGMGVKCPRNILINSRTWLLDLPEQHALDNLNTPEELATARSRLLAREEFSV